MTVHTKQPPLTILNFTKQGGAVYYDVDFSIYQFPFKIVIFRKVDYLSIIPTSDHQSLSLLPINSEPLNILLLSHAFVLLAGRFVIRFWGNIYDFN